MPKIKNETENNETKNNDILYANLEDVAEGTYTIDCIYSTIKTSKKNKKYRSITLYVTDSNEVKLGINIPIEYVNYLEGIKRYCPNVSKVTLTSKQYSEFIFE